MSYVGKLALNEFETAFDFRPAAGLKYVALAATFSRYGHGQRGAKIVENGPGPYNITITKIVASA